MTHELKIWPQYFNRVLDGSKTFEVRKNDRGFQFGDSVILKEWDPTEDEFDEESPGGMYLGSYTQARGYTGRQLEFVVGYIYSLPNEMVVFSLIKPVPSDAGKK